MGDMPQLRWQAAGGRGRDGLFHRDQAVDVLLSCVFVLHITGSLLVW